MTTIRIPIENYQKLMERLRTKKSKDFLEVKSIGTTYKEVRTSMKAEEVRELCKGLGKLVIS